MRLCDAGRSAASSAMQTANVDRALSALFAELVHVSLGKCAQTRTSLPIGKRQEIHARDAGAWTLLEVVDGRVDEAANGLSQVGATRTCSHQRKQDRAKF